MNNVIWDDLGFFVKSLKGLPASESLTELKELMLTCGLEEVF